MRSSSNRRPPLSNITARTSGPRREGDCLPAHWSSGDPRMRKRRLPCAVVARPQQRRVGADEKEVAVVGSENTSLSERSLTALPAALALAPVPEVPPLTCVGISKKWRKAAKPVLAD